MQISKMFKVIILIFIVHIIACDMPSEYTNNESDINLKETGIEIYSPTDKLMIDDSVKFQLFALLSNGKKEEKSEQVEWKSSVIDLVEIDASGFVTAIKAGICEIEAIYNGYKAKKTIYISEPISYEHIKISEVFYDAEGSDSGKEFIEIVNTGTKDCNLKGCSLIDGSMNSSDYIFDDCIIKSGEYLVVVQNFETFSQTFNNIEIDVLSKFSFSLNNSGETIFLKSPDSSVIDYVFIEGGSTDFPATNEWGNSGNLVANSGYSVSRLIEQTDTDTEEDWQITLPTPGS